MIYKNSYKIQKMRIQKGIVNRLIKLIIINLFMELLNLREKTKENIKNSS